MGILRVIIDRNLPCRTMVCTRASNATSSLAAHQQPCQAPLQEGQDPESKPVVEVEDVGSDDTTRDNPVPGKLIREASTTTDEEDSELVYDHTRFHRDKAKCRYFRYYHRRKIIIERGATIEEFNEHAPRVQAMLDAQGWTNMVEDHCPVVETIVWELYVNLHQRRGDLFCTWLRGTVIEVTTTLISKIIGHLVYMTWLTPFHSIISPLKLT
jgi:hypothetical protein